MRTPKQSIDWLLRLPGILVLCLLLLAIPRTRAQTEYYKAVQFGTNDFITFGPDPRWDTAGEGTLEIQLRSDQVPSSPEQFLPVLSHGEGTNARCLVRLERLGRALEISFPRTGKQVFTRCDLSDGDFHQVAIVTRFHQTEIYIDGEQSPIHDQASIQRYLTNPPVITTDPVIVTGTNLTITKVQSPRGREIEPVRASKPRPGTNPPPSRSLLETNAPEPVVLSLAAGYPAPAMVAQALHLGSDGLKTGFQGELRTVRLWNRVLGTNELEWAFGFQGLPDANSPTYSSLVAYSYFTDQRRTLNYTQPEFVMPELKGRPGDRLRFALNPPGRTLHAVYVRRNREGIAELRLEFGSSSRIPVFRPPRPDRHQERLAKLRLALSETPRTNSAEYAAKLAALRSEELGVPVPSNPTDHQELTNGWSMLRIPSAGNLDTIAGTHDGDGLLTLRLIASAFGSRYDKTNRIDSGVISTTNGPGGRFFTQRLPDGMRGAGLVWQLNRRALVSSIAVVGQTPWRPVREQDHLALTQGLWIDSDERLPEHSPIEASITPPYQPPLSLIPSLYAAMDIIIERLNVVGSGAENTLPNPTYNDEQRAEFSDLARKITAAFNELGAYAGRVDLLGDLVAQQAKSDFLRTMKAAGKPTDFKDRSLTEEFRARGLDTSFLTNWTRWATVEAPLATNHLGMLRAADSVLAGSRELIFGEKASMNPTPYRTAIITTPIFVEMLSSLVVEMGKLKEAFQNKMVSWPPPQPVTNDTNLLSTLQFYSPPSPSKKSPAGGNYSTPTLFTFLASSANQQVEMKWNTGRDTLRRTSGDTYRSDRHQLTLDSTGLWLQELQEPRRRRHLVRPAPYDPPGDGKLAWGATFSLGDRPSLVQANFRGYNLRLMHPKNYQVDSGADGQVFRYPADSSTDYYTTDNRLIVPHGLHYRPDNAGKENGKTDIVKSSEEYANTWSTHLGANVSGGIGPVGISASVNAKWGGESDSLRESNRSRAICRTIEPRYALVLDQSRMPLSDAFQQRVIELRDRLLAYGALDEGSLNACIQTFGTHYPYAVTYGGMAVMEMDFNEDTVRDMQSANRSLDAEVSASFGSFSAGASGGSASSNTQTTSNTTSSERTRFNTYGGTMSRSGGWTLGKGEEVPIYLDLRPITDLLTPSYFADDWIHNEVREALRQAWLNYFARPASDFKRDR
jgi:hypothetical protein